MKLSELKRIIDLTVSTRTRADQEEVNIIVKMPYATVGAHPMVKVKSASSGFDWENGKFLLWPEESLTYHDRDFRQKYEKLLEEHYRLKRDYDNLRKQTKSL